MDIEKERGKGEVLMAMRILHEANKNRTSTLLYGSTLDKLDEWLSIGGDGIEKLKNACYCLDDRTFISEAMKKSGITWEPEERKLWFNGLRIAWEVYLYYLVHDDKGSFAKIIEKAFPGMEEFGINDENVINALDCVIQTLIGYIDYFTDDNLYTKEILLKIAKIEMVDEYEFEKLKLMYNEKIKNDIKS